MSQLPDDVTNLAADCNLTVSGWDSDDDSALVHGPDVNYIGSKAEVVAFLTAWQQCQQLKITRVMVEAEEAPGVHYGFVVWNAGTLIQPTQSAQLITRPQTRMFRGDRVAIPDAIAEHFVVEDIRVGNRSVFLQSGSVPAVVFAARIADSTALFELARRGDGPHEIIMAQSARLEFGRRLSFPPCMTAQDLVITVTNVSTEPRAFRGLAVGKYAQ